MFFRILLELLYLLSRVKNKRQKKKLKKQLKKQMLRARMRKTQLVMNHVRSHQHERDNPSSAEKLSKDIEKKKKPKSFSKGLTNSQRRSWQKRVMASWRSRPIENEVITMRKRIRNRKQRAMDLWETR